MYKELSIVILVITFFLLLFIWATSGRLQPEQLSQIKTYSQELNNPSAELDTFTVMTYNIGYLSGMLNGLPVQTTREFFDENLTKVVRALDEIKPDFVGIQEIDFMSKRSYYQNQLDSLARFGNYSYTASAVNWDKNYVPYPYWPPAVHFGRILSGQALLSRFPIQSQERIVLPRPQNLSFYYAPFYLERLAQFVKVDVGRTLIIINVHFDAYDFETRERQVKLLLEISRRYINDFPLLIIGDFNSLPPQSESANNLPQEEYLEWKKEATIKLLLNENHLREAFPNSIYRQNEQATYTFSSKEPTKKIDYIFYNSNKIAPVEWFVATNTEQAADHLPVVLRFKFVHE